MRLYTRFKSIIDSFSVIENAWFTSFNLSVYFVEQYILPALLGLEPPKDIRDSARLQDILREREGALDIRFFADCSMIDLSQGKKTSINIHPVSSHSFSETFHNGVFHPKVVLLTGTDKKGNPKAHVITGSANLTLAGWGRNEEGVIDYPIYSEKNWSSVYDFFSHLFQTQDINIPEIAFHPEKDKENWTFLSSLDEGAPQSKLLPEGSQKLNVFSPYFSPDILGFFSKHIQPMGIPTVKIFAGFDTGKLHFPKEELHAITESSAVSVFHTQVPEEDFIQHRKIWITESTTAIGSWNMTEAALGLTKNSNNIEAGIVVEESMDLSVRKDIQLSGNDDFYLMEKTELNQDPLQKEHRPQYYGVRVLFDWSNGKYTIKADEYEDLLIRLPGVKDPQKLSISIAIESRNDLVRNKLYTLYDRDGRELQTGLILEKNIANSPLYEYETLDALLMAFSRGSNDRSTQRSLLERTGDITQLQEIEENISSRQTTLDLSYFTLFRGIYSLYQSWLVSYRSNEIEALKWIDVLPGNMVEFDQKLEAIITGKDSLVYKYCLFKEFDSLLGKIEKELTSEFHKGVIGNLKIKSNTRLKSLEIKPAVLKSFDSFFKGVDTLKPYPSGVECE